MEYGKELSKISSMQRLQQKVLLRIVFDVGKNCQKLHYLILATYHSLIERTNIICWRSMTLVVERNRLWFLIEEI